MILRYDLADKHDTEGTTHSYFGQVVQLKYSSGPVFQKQPAADVKACSICGMQFVWGTFLSSHVYAMA